MRACTCELHWTYISWAFLDEAGEYMEVLPEQERMPRNLARELCHGALFCHDALCWAHCNLTLSLSRLDLIPFPFSPPASHRSRCNQKPQLTVTAGPNLSISSHSSASQTRPSASAMSSIASASSSRSQVTAAPVKSHARGFSRSTTERCRC